MQPGKQLYTAHQQFVNASPIICSLVNSFCGAPDGCFRGPNSLWHHHWAV